MAYDLLPYSDRTRSYSAWGTTARGDIRTVGMAGATLGLGDTFIASLDNPSGLAMTLNGADLNFASNVIYDRNIQNYDSAMNTSNFGVAFSHYPWGFSVGYVLPYVEGQTYLTPNSAREPQEIEVSTRQFYLSGARLFFKDHLALGASLILGQAKQTITPVGAALFSSTSHSYAIGASFGATYRLPSHLLLGFSYSIPMHYNGNYESHPTSVLPGFNRSVEVPGRIGLGLGWIPNRVFRADFTSFLVGSTEGTALLRNDSIFVGQNATFQPRIGLAYIFLDYKELKGTAFLGSYFETSRIENTDSRIHETMGVELKPWIFSLGWGLDNATGYRNYLFSLGVDIFNVMAKLDIIPTAWHPPYKGIAPSPTSLSDEGLPRPMVKNWRPRGPNMNPLEVGLSIPEKLEQKAEAIGKSVGDNATSIGQGFVNFFKSKKPSKNSRKNNKKSKIQKKQEIEEFNEYEIPVLEPNTD